MNSSACIRHLWLATAFLGLAGGLLHVQAAPAPTNAPVLARMDLDGASPSAVPFPVLAHLRDGGGREYVLIHAESAPLLLSKRPVQILAEATADSPFYLARSRRPANRADLPASLRILHDDGRNLLLAPSGPADRAALSKLGYDLRRLPSSPMIFATPQSAALRSDPPTLSSNAFVADMIARVQTTNLHARMSELTGEVPVMADGVFTNIATRNTYETHSLNRALAYAQSRLQALGLTVSQQDWSAYDPWEGRNVASRNLIAERTGTTAPDEIVILCAHVDSLPETPDPAPGADDNASGSIGVLAAARAMRDFEFERTIRYVLFTGEEQGCLGSAAYADKVIADGDNVVGVLNLDMIAYDGNDDGHLNLTARLPSNPGHAADMGLVAAFTNAVSLYGLSDRLVPLVYTNSEGYSDHEPFWNDGIPAILAIEDWENGDITPHYHQVTDTLATLNLPFYEAFTKACVGAASHLAGPIGPVSDAQLVSNAVHEVRIELERTLGKPVPSLSLVLQTPEGEYFASSAETPEQALATNTTFRFASNTKNFTATAVLLLQQMGLLNITNRIVDMIPGTDQPFIPAGINWAIPNKGEITIQQLLRHSAGVYDVDNDPVPGLDGKSYTEWMTDQDPAHPFTVEEMVAQATLHQLSYFAPDEGYHYSNTGYAMLAEIVGRVYSHYMGEPKTLSDFLYDHVVGPDIRFPNQADDTALPEPFSPGTERRPPDITIIVSNCNMSAQVGEGNGYGTLPALNRHIRSTMRGEGVLSNEFVRLMQADTSPSNANYALGCVWTPDIGFGHNGCRVGNLSFMAYNPDTDVSVAVYLGLVDYSDLMNSFMVCYMGMYDAATRALEALGYPRTPTLAHEAHTNLMLSADETNIFYFTAVNGAFYAVTFSNSTTSVFTELSAAVNPGETLRLTNNFIWQGDAPGTYRLAVSSTSATECALSLIALKWPEPSDFSELNWTNAFIAAHDVFSRQYAFGDWKSVDWGALYSNTLPRIAAAQATTNEVAYYAALHEYVGSIPDGHIALKGTNAAVPAAWGEEIAGGGYGLAVAELEDGRVIAAALLTHGPAQLAGMEAGAEIVSWDGLAPTSAIAQINVAAYPLRALAGPMASSPQATWTQQRLEQARLLVRGPLGTNVDVQFINPGSLATQTVALTATADTNATFALLDFAKRQSPSSDPVEYRLMDNGLGYLLIRFEAIFAGPDDLSVIHSNVAEAVKLFVSSNAPGVIVDVRGNLGGDDQLAAMLCGYFHRTNAFYERQTWYNTLNDTFTELTFDSMNGWSPLDYISIQPQSVFYGGPVAVLVNLGTVSSGEGVAMGIGALPNARVIGFHGTHGSFGMAGATLALPGGYSIHYPFGQSLDENGVIQLDSQNGVGGVAPEIRIPMSASNVLAFAAGTDVELNYATDYLLGLQYYTNTIAQTTALITNLMAEHNIPALSIALVDGTNIVWAQGFGTANREAGIPADADTIYRIASCSKTFASASIMRLQDAGLLNIEDDVTNSVPAFSLLPRYPDQSSITIRELLAHQAQLPGCYFRHADSLIPYDYYYDQTLALLTEDYLVEPRGFLQKYNNNGFTLIEGVVAGANTNGLSYSEFAAAKLFQPMGMSNTTFRLSGSQTNLLAKVYRNGALAPDEYVNTPGSGGAYSTAADLARYARFLLGYGSCGGVTILSSNAVAALWSDQSDEVALVNKEGYAKSGLGWDQIADESFAYAGKMAWKDGDSLNYSAIICVMPEYGLAAVALNSIPGADTAAAPAAKMALKLALNERFGLPLPSTNPPAFPVSPVKSLTEQELAGIVGTYSAEGGYDLVTGTVSAITWIAGADGASPVRHEGLVPHEDGWFSTTNTPEFRLSFTNVGGRVILRNHMRYEEYLRILAQAERFTPAPLSAAWSNRVGKAWITADLEPDSYLWLLGFYPTLQLDIADGVLSVYSSPCQTLQPQDDNLAFPLLSTASQPSALQVKHTNGHEVICYSGYNFLRVDELPALQVGQSSTGTLAAGASAPFQFTITDTVWHGLYVSPTNLSLRQETSDLSTPGTYSLILQNPSTSAIPYTLRLYNFTNTIARVASLITNLMAEHNLVGCGFSMVDGNHSVMESGFGYADKARDRIADENTVFMIGSCSKTFGAVAAMQLAEEGLLDLDASITNALPDFAIHQRFADSVITPRSILTHHSGLPGDVFNRGFSYVPSLDAPDFVQSLLADDFTLMPTNTCWAYNNSGIVMLGQAYRHLAGTELPEFARARLFDRMGMTNSSIVNDLPSIKQNLSRPYIDGEVFPDEYINLFFAGSIYSTASDMARYMRMLLNGGMGDQARVVSNATLAAMAEKQNTDIPLDQFNSMLNMGIGFVLDPPALQYMGKVIWHDGGTVYFRTLLRVALDAQLGCFISCNSAEAGAANDEIVNSALKWAYEEKTGIAPPPPVVPEDSPVVHAPPAVVALATNGPFVAGNGFMRFESDVDGLLAHSNAHTDDPDSASLVYRENGWFSRSNSLSTQYLFTQSVGRVICVYKSYSDGVPTTAILGERSPNVTGFDPAWSNRLGRWWATNMHPDDISWLSDETRLTAPSVKLFSKDQVLLLDCENAYAMTATNPALAFAAGLGRNKGSALQVRPDGSLSFLGVHYRAEDGIPLLSPGASTNGLTAGDEIHWFRIPAAPGQPLTVDLDTPADLTAYLYSSLDTSTLGQANRSHAFQLDATNAQPLLVAVVRNGTNLGPWRLAVHTNALPFYAPLAPADWPAQLTESAHRYPNADFGHVFVPENRAAPTAHVLKIAVVRMLSTNPAARPLLFLNGGPGDSGIRCSYQYFLQGFLDTHHVYLIDPRGVNLSQPSFEFATDEELDAFQYRLRMLQQADLSAIHTAELAGDVNAVVAAFGLAEADLMGQSYGTFLAQAILRLDPPWLRAVVLDGVVAPNIPGLSQTGPARKQALDAFFADLAANPLYPHFADTFYALAERLQDHPAEVPIHGETNLLNGIGFLDAVLNQLTSTDLGSRERIPGIVWRAAHNEDAALGELFVFRNDTNVVFDSIHDPVQQILVIKHDMLPFDSLEAATNACAGLHPLLAELSIGFMEDAVDAAAQFDDYGQAAPAITHPVVSSIPALVINGTYDTQTAVDWAAEVASHMPNAHFVVPPAVGHGVLFATNGCTLQIMCDFLANPTQRPDTSCMPGLVPDYPRPWPADADVLAAGDSLSGAVTNPGVASWYTLASPAPAAPAGGIADVHCQIRIVQMPDPFRVSIYGANDGAHIAQHRGPGTLDFVSDGTPFVLAIQPGSDGEQTGDYEIEFSVPLLMRKLDIVPPNIGLVWQGPTGGLVSVEAAPFLALTNTFVPVIENLASTNLLLQQSIPLVDPDPLDPDHPIRHFFRIIE